MGKVSKAHNTVIDRGVVIKALPTEPGTEPGYRQRFHREAQNGRAAPIPMTHPNAAGWPVAR